jgi:hypothetical protein
MEDFMDLEAWLSEAENNIANLIKVLKVHQEAIRLGQEASHEILDIVKALTNAKYPE